MSDEQNVDMMAGLNAVVAIMEAIRVDVRAIGPVDRVRLASLQWAVDKLAGDLHDANVEIRKARLEVASAKREADEAREVRDAARQLHLVECRKYNAEVERRLALEKQVAELTAERDAAREQHLVECRRNNAGMERRLALETQVAGLSSKVRELEKQLAEMKGREELQNVFSAGQAGKILGLEGVVESLTAERDRLRDRLAEIERLTVEAFRGKTIAEVAELIEATSRPQAELSGNSGRLSADTIARMSGNGTEPAPTETEPPEWHRWRRGTKLFHPRHPDVTRCLHDATTEGMERLYNDGWRELPAEPAPEPYQWQVGDEVEHDGVVRKIRCSSGGRGRLLIEHVPAHQQWFEAIGWKLHRKASDIQPQAPEPYDWQVGDEIEDDGGVRRPVTDRDAKGWVSIKGNGALPQFEWERRRWKLHRKASELPDLPPFTPQQVAEFAAVTEPFDDSVSAAAADEGRP